MLAPATQVSPCSCMLTWAVLLHSLWPFRMQCLCAVVTFAPIIHFWLLCPEPGFRQLTLKCDVPPFVVLFPSSVHSCLSETHLMIIRKEQSRQQRNSCASLDITLRTSARTSGAEFDCTFAGISSQAGAGLMTKALAAAAAPPSQTYFERLFWSQASQQAAAAVTGKPVRYTLLLCYVCRS